MIRTFRAYQFLVDNGGYTEENTVDILDTYGKSASFCQITNFSETDLLVRVNSSEVFYIFGGTSSSFDNFKFDKIEFANPQSGGANQSVEVILGIDGAVNNDIR